MGHESLVSLVAPSAFSLRISLLRFDVAVHTRGCLPLSRPSAPPSRDGNAWQSSARLPQAGPPTGGGRRAGLCHARDLGALVGEFPSDPVFREGWRDPEVGQDGLHAQGFSMPLYTQLHFNKIFS